MREKESKIKKLFQIVIPKSCPQCGKRALKKEGEKINCEACGVTIETQVENTRWFFSSQEKSVVLDLKKELVEKQKRIRDRLFELQNMRKLL
ncbi:MAG: hypothetical protein JSW73_03210 [Candidatus Woesearchaeota archaeon]|nr:MAG: hypothetical protein JSW73_03210 [Candidatus Woesearchaeota archaeon]